MKLWLVRHARPLIAPGICYGATDVPADEPDTRQVAQVLAQALPAGLPVRVSPLQRCALLARCLHELRPDLAPSPDARLVEMDFGCWEGQRWSDIPPAEYERWTAEFATWRFGGRESVQDLMQRVAAARDDTALTAPEAVWITHAGVIRAASLLTPQGFAPIQHAAQWPREAPAWGQWRQLVV